MSRGGVRIVVEETVAVGDQFEVLIGGGDDASSRPGRVVWVRNETDGQIVGLKYLDSSEGPPGPSGPPAGTT